MRTLLALLTVAGLLAACGDNPSGGDVMQPVADNNTVPASALTSPAAFASYVGSLPASDSAEPLDVNAATPPTSETDEPQPI